MFVQTCVIAQLTFLPLTVLNVFPDYHWIDALSQIYASRYSWCLVEWSKIMESWTFSWKFTFLIIIKYSPFQFHDNFFAFFFFCSMIGLKPRTLYILGKPFVTQWHLQNQMELKILIQFDTVWKKLTLSEIVAYLHLFFILIKVISCVLMFLSKQFFLFAGSLYDPCAYYYFTATLFLLHLSILRSKILNL